MLRRLFVYDPETGNLTYLKRPEDLFPHRPSREHFNKNLAGTIAGALSSRQGYLIVQIQGKQYQAHRIAWALYYSECPDTVQIGHLNEIKTDNRIANLVVTDDHLTAKKRNTGKGIVKRGENFEVSLCKRGKREYIGTFSSYEKAREARFEAERGE